MKRVALISDIHGNAVALEAVLADIEHRGAEEIVCLGDVAAGGPEPRPAVNRLRELRCLLVRGNADDWLLGKMPADESDDGLQAIVEWARGELTKEDLAYLENSPPTIELDLAGSRRMLCFHGSPRANSERLLATTPDAYLCRLFADAEADVVAGGHTHLQVARRVSGGLFVNPGSVGLPVVPSLPPGRARFAEYAVVEADAEIAVELRRVPVDAGALERAGRRSGMPHPDRWEVGLGRRVARRNAEALSQER